MLYLNLAGLFIPDFLSLTIPTTRLSFLSLSSFLTKLCTSQGPTSICVYRRISKDIEDSMSSDYQLSVLGVWYAILLSENIDIKNHDGLRQGFNKN